MLVLLLPWDVNEAGVPAMAWVPVLDEAPGATAPELGLAELLADARDDGPVLPEAVGELFFDGGGLPPVGLPVGPTPEPGAHGPWPALSQSGGSGAIFARKFPSGWPAQNVGLRHFFATFKFLIWTALSAPCSLYICSKLACARFMGSGE